MTVSSTPTRYLTKSRFVLAIECPTKLYYTGKPEYLDTSLDDSFLAALAEGGYQVGALARAMFPGELVGDAGHEAALARTKELLAAENVTVHEAALAAGDLFIRVDLLRKRGHSIDLVEVKAKSYDPRTDGTLRGARGRPLREYLPYLYDIAFQRHVASLALPGIQLSCRLLLADTSRVATVDGLNQRFPVRREDGRVVVDMPTGADLTALGEPILTEILVDELVDDILSGTLELEGAPRPFAEFVATLAKACRLDRRLNPQPGTQCATCSFKSAKPPKPGDLRSGFHECWRDAFGFGPSDFAAGTVLDLWNSSAKQALMTRGVLRLTDVRPMDLGLAEPVPAPDAEGMDRRLRQWYQVSGCWPGGGPFFLHRAGLASDMGRWRWPLHFIDFETSAVAIPFARGHHPYETIAFQFSHHVLDAGGRVEHRTQFLLAEPGVDPTLQFLRALRSALQVDQGTVFRWAAHENTVLNQLRRRLLTAPSPQSDTADLLAFVDTLVTRRDEGHIGDRCMVDLAQLAAARFFHPDTAGSSSLKVVLPAVMRSSKRLRDLYSVPRYGTPDMPSLNFSEGWTWWVEQDGVVRDPYSLLPPVFDDQPANVLPQLNEGLASDLAEGGAAMAAYARLQFEWMKPEQRHAIEAALLRYCELDTLAMVMVVQSWQDWL